MRSQLVPPTAPSITAYLERSFAEADADGSGQLCREEFFSLMQAKLGLTREHTFTLLNLIDEDGSGHISRAELVGRAPGMIQRLYEAQESFAADWVRLRSHLPGNGHFWYNKRLGAGARQGQRLSKPPFANVTDHMVCLFQQHDTQKDGVVSRKSLVGLVRRLGLGLTDAEVDALVGGADFNLDGVVDWPEFLSLAPSMIQQVYSELGTGTGTDEDFDRDWVAMRSTSAAHLAAGLRGAPFYFNKRTGCTQWRKPHKPAGISKFLQDQVLTSTGMY
jgi:Ca2+-binding EF-hand superfamily protein